MKPLPPATVDQCSCSATVPDLTCPLTQSHEIPAMEEKLKAHRAALQMAKDGRIMGE